MGGGGGGGEEEGGMRFSERLKGPALGQRTRPPPITTTEQMQMRKPSPPSSYLRSHSRVLQEIQARALPDQHRIALRQLERTQTERDSLRHENEMLKLKVKFLKERLHNAKSIFDLDPQQTATRPVMSLSMKSMSKSPSIRGTLSRKRDIVRPYVEKGLMSGTIYMMGEAIACGLLFNKDFGYGFYPGAFLHYSVLHSTLVGMLANGPMLHLFFEVIERLICFESQLINVVCKIFVDQVVWGLLWNSCYIFLMNLATDSPGFGYIGEGLGTDAHYDLSKGFLSAFRKGFLDVNVHFELLKQGLRMLPWDIVCYSIVPLRLRALWVAIGDVAWVTILSQYD